MSFAVRIRRKATMFAVDRFFYSLAALGRLHPASRPERHGLEVTRDVAYGDLPVQRLDVWRPAGAGPGGAKGERPCVLYVHGGGFRILSKDTHWVMALMFARAGYVVFNVDYHLAPAHPFPAAVRDVARAYGWVVDHAGEHGADPSRIVLAGESAGGNLVTALSLATCFERSEPWAREVFQRGVVPAAVLPACGLLQVTEPERFARRWPHMSRAANDQIVVIASEYLKDARDLPPESLDFADPLLVFERDEPSARPLPPFFVACGTRDPLLDDARRLHRALERRGATSELRLYRGELHAFHAAVLTPNARRFWRDTFGFLEARVR
jgi:acetyl esterase